MRSLYDSEFPHLVLQSMLLSAVLLDLGVDVFHQAVPLHQHISECGTCEDPYNLSRFRFHSMRTKWKGNQSPWLSLPWSWGWEARQGRQRRFCPLFLRSSQDRRDTGKHNLAWFDVSTTIWRYVISFYLFPFFPCPETITTCSLVSHLSVSEFHHNLICVCYRWHSAIRSCDFLEYYWINQC